MRWPSDRKFTDAQGKILDHWRGPMGVLEPLLALTPAQFSALQQLIAAYIEAQEDNEAPDPGTAINLALPITDEPLFSEDYALIYKTSDAAGRRTALSRFARPPVLISTTAASGAADVDISVPTTYTDMRLVYRDLSATSAGHFLIGFSEDGGATLLTQAQGLFTNGASQTGTGSSGMGLTVTAPAAAAFISGIISVPGYSGIGNKISSEDGINSVSTLGWKGVRLITSTTAINFVRISCAAGTIDSGTIELWGIP